MEEQIIHTSEAYQEQQLVKPSTVSFLERLWDSLPEYEVPYHFGMKYGEQYKYVVWDFRDTDHANLELLHVTDVQFGHVMCNYDRVIEYRDWILDKPNRYMLWGGDMIDAWTMFSPSQPTDQLIVDPQSQVMRFVETWAPARHRILGYVGGNHERRGIKAFGDLGTLIASLLKIPYSNGKQLLDIHFGEHDPFKITLWHGSGCAVTKGAIAQKLFQFMSQGDSQLYLMGHLHQSLIIPDWREERQDHKIELVKVVGAIGTSFLETIGTYGEIKGYRPADVMMARAVLERNGHWEVTLR